jgi:hypothetical protein
MRLSQAVKVIAERGEDLITEENLGWVRELNRIAQDRGQTLA